MIGNRFTYKGRCWTITGMGMDGFFARPDGDSNTDELKDHYFLNRKFRLVRNPASLGLEIKEEPDTF